VAPVVVSGRGRGPSLIGQAADEDPEFVVDRTAVERLDAELEVGGIEEPTSASIRMSVTVTAP
jgi:hypothetical protein